MLTFFRLLVHHYAHCKWSILLGCFNRNFLQCLTCLCLQSKIDNAPAFVKKLWFLAGRGCLYEVRHRQINFASGLLEITKILVCYVHMYSKLYSAYIFFIIACNCVATFQDSGIVALFFSLTQWNIFQKGTDGEMVALHLSVRMQILTGLCHGVIMILSVVICVDGCVYGLW